MYKPRSMMNPETEECKEDEHSQSPTLCCCLGNSRRYPTPSQTPGPSLDAETRSALDSLDNVLKEDGNASDLGCFIINLA